MSGSAWTRFIRGGDSKSGAGAGGRAGARPAASGWFAVDVDGFVRGWCVDRSALDRRLAVEILVDGTTLAEVTADRLNARLQEQGDGDGHYAFVCMIPASLRDGKTHSVAARITTPGYHLTALKTRTSAFILERDLEIPTITVRTVTAKAIDGVVGGALSRKLLQLDLLIDGVRVPFDDVSTRWSTRGDQTHTFSLIPRAQSPLSLLQRASLAVPGMLEAGQESVPLGPLARYQIQPISTDTFRLTVDPTVMLGDGQVFEAEVRAGDDVRERLQLSFRRNVARFTLAPDPEQRPSFLRLLAPGGEPFGAELAVPHPDMRHSLVSNSAFRRWSGEGPDDWQQSPDISYQHAFFAFAEEVRIETSISGQTLVAHIAQSTAPRLILRQQLSGPLPRGALHARIMARASHRTTVELRLVDEAGQSLSSTRFNLAEGWSNEHAALDLAGGKPAALEAWVAANDCDDGVYVEIAGLRLGDDSLSFADRSDPALAAPRYGENLVVNPRLQRWPNGLSFTDARRRFEITEGVYFYKRGNTSDVQIAAVPAQGQDGHAVPGQYGLCLKVQDVEFCRLEFALVTDMLKGALRLRFWGMSGTVFDPVTARFDRKQRWAAVNRISLIKRTTSFTADGELTKTDEVAGVFARRVMLRREPECFLFDLAVEANNVEEGESEYLITFEFNRGVALTLHSVDVRLDEGPGSATSELVSSLALEDRNITGQVPFIAGLESWLSPSRIMPLVTSRNESRPAAEPKRWSWRYGTMGSVEVVVCVHNAVDETLACLRSMIGASTVPHTVHIINDSSDADGRNRLLNFIADKPWIRMSDNPENLGYTASAHRGVVESDADWVALLNSDTIVSQGWLEGMLDAAASDPQIAFVGPVSNAATYQSVPELYDGAGKWAVNGLPAGWSVDDMARYIADHAERTFPEAPLLNGFCTLIRRSVFVDVGGLDATRFPSGYGEENDLCLRVTRAGHKLVIADHVYVYHTKSASFGETRRNELAKEGDRMLKALYDDVNFGNLGRQFAEIPALTLLRQRVRKAYRQPAGEDAS